MKEGTKERLNVPIECLACHKMIEPGKPIIRHHTSYYPEKTIPVHGSCHIYIHRTNKYTNLKPDLRQLLRWARQKKWLLWNSPTYTHDWYFLNFMYSVENEFVTPELENNPMYMINRRLAIYNGDSYR